jgi:exopolysaccharide production protein ExoQ
MLHVSRRSTMNVVVGFCLLIGGVAYLPIVIGSLIATEQYIFFQAFGLLTVMALLFFCDSRYLIFATAMVVMLSASHLLAISERFLMLRWVFMGALAVRAVSDMFIGKKQFRVRGVDLWAILLIGLAFFSQTYSLHPKLTIYRSTALAMLYVSTFWGVYHYLEKQENIEAVLKCFLWIAVIFFVGGVFFGHQDTRTARFAGLFTNPNGLGFYAALMMPIALWAHYTKKSKWAIILLFMAVGGLIASRPRSAILACGLSVGYILWSRQVRGKHVWLVPLILFSSLSLLVYNELFGLTSILEFLRLDARTIIAAGGRWEAWVVVFQLISRRPWLGYGYGMEDRLFREFDIVFSEHQGAYAHNSFLGLTSQLGIIGCFLFFAPLLFFFIRRTIRISRMDAGDSRRLLQIALNAIILTGIVHAFFESELYVPGNAFSFTFWSIVVMAYRMDELVFKKPKRKRLSAKEDSS